MRINSLPFPGDNGDTLGCISDFSCAGVANFIFLDLGPASHQKWTTSPPTQNQRILAFPSVETGSHLNICNNYKFDSDHLKLWLVFFPPLRLVACVQTSPISIWALIIFSGIYSRLPITRTFRVNNRRRFDDEVSWSMVKLYRKEKGNENYFELAGGYS